MVCEQKKRNENVSNLQLLETSYRTEEHCRSMDTGSMPPTHLYYPPKEAEQSQASQAAFDTHRSIPTYRRADNLRTEIHVDEM
jgi:hypothetical protein